MYLFNPCILQGGLTTLKTEYPDIIHQFCLIELMCISIQSLYLYGELPNLKAVMTSQPGGGGDLVPTMHGCVVSKCEGHGSFFIFKGVK